MIRLVRGRRRPHEYIDLRSSLWEEQDGRCIYCDAPMTIHQGRRMKLTDATVDHIHPKAKGGTNANENLALACWECNSAKADRTVDEFLGWAS